MKKPYAGMSPGLTAFTWLLDNVARRSITEQDLDGIRASRATVHHAQRGARWITGAPDPTVRISAAAAPARDGTALPLRVYSPPVGGPLPVIVYFHGGGWTVGSTQQYDPLCSLLAAQLPALVVSVDYRLAPEHRAPTAAHDSIDAARWIADHASEFGGDSARLAVAGDSAGGGLAAIVAQEFRDRDDRRIVAQALLYPGVDMTKSGASVKQHSKAPILTELAMDAFKDHYMGPPGRPGRPDDRDPIVSPLFGRVDGLAPALIQTADLDPIRDDGIRYAERLTDAGVPVRLTNYVGVPHGFAFFPGATGVGRQHQAELVTELRRLLGAGARTNGSAR